MKRFWRFFVCFDPCRGVSTRCRRALVSFTLLHRSVRQANENGPKIDHKAVQNRATITPKSIKIDPNRSQGPSGRSRAIRDTSGALPDRSGRCSESSRDDPGAPRDAPGAPRDPQSDRKVRPGGPESTFLSVLFGQSFARRSRSDFRTISGSLVEAATRNPLAMAQSKLMSDVFCQNARSTPKTTKNRAKTEAERPPERAERSKKRPQASAVWRRTRDKKKSCAHERVAAQEERFGGAVGAPDARRLLTRLANYT